MFEHGCWTGSSIRPRGLTDAGLRGEDAFMTRRVVPQDFLPGRTMGRRARTKAKWLESAPSQRARSVDGSGSQKGLDCPVAKWMSPLRTQTPIPLEAQSPHRHELASRVACRGY